MEAAALCKEERFCLAELFKNKPKRQGGGGSGVRGKQGGEICAVVTELKDGKT